MPPLILSRAVFSLLSLLILAAAGGLLWIWWEGTVVEMANGSLVRVRETWPLVVGGLLLAWSFAGRFLWTLLLAKSDRDPTRPVRDEGRMVAGADGAELYVETHGNPSGPTLVLTHGWGLDSTIWNYAKRDLGARFRVMTWDLPGLGRSKPGQGGVSEGVSLDAFAANLRAVVEAAGPGPVLLVGHSIGGMTIQTLVRQDPAFVTERVAGIVLVNTTWLNPLKTMILSGLAQALRKPVIEPLMRLTMGVQPLAWLMAWQSYLSGSAHMANRLGFGPHVTRSQLEHTTLLATRNPPGVLARGNLAMFDWDSHEALAAVRTPVLVLGGDRDIITKLEASEVIAGFTPGATLRVMPEANHMGFLEQAELYNGAIADFAEAVTRRPASISEGFGAVA